MDTVKEIEVCVSTKIGEVLANEIEFMDKEIKGKY